MSRLNSFKIMICSIIAILLFFGPYTEFIPYSASLSANSDFWLWGFVHDNFITLKYFILLLCFVCLPAYRFSFLPVTMLAVLFGVFNWFCSVDSPGGLYNYNTHLNIFIVGLSVVVSYNFFSKDRSDKIEKNFFQFLQCYTLTFYLQSGLSKLIFGGYAWLISGRTAWIFSLELGTGVGKILAHYPAVFVVGSFAIVLFEVLIFPLYLLNFFRRYLIIAAICLHLSVFLIMGISFWHLWLLYPIIFANVLFPSLYKNNYITILPSKRNITNNMA